MPLVAICLQRGGTPRVGHKLASHVAFRQERDSGFGAGLLILGTRIGSTTNPTRLVPLNPSGSGRWNGHENAGDPEGQTMPRTKPRPLKPPASPNAAPNGIGETPEVLLAAARDEPFSRSHLSHSAIGRSRRWLSLHFKSVALGKRDCTAIKLTCTCRLVALDTTPSHQRKVAAGSATFPPPDRSGAAPPVGRSQFPLRVVARSTIRLPPLAPLLPPMPAQRL